MRGRAVPEIAFDLPAGFSYNTGKMGCRRLLPPLRLAAFLFLPLFWGGSCRDGGPTVIVQVERNTIIASNYNFIYEHWQEEKLTRLLKQENFKEIRAENEFAYFVKLCHWAHSQWPRSVPDPYPLSNALDILVEIRAKKTGGFCGQYAYVLADVLKSLGFYAVRYVELWSSRGESHFVVEAWSNLFGKWVILDPDNDLYYELTQNGLPAGALEIRSALYGGPKVQARSAENPSRLLGQTKVELYAHIAVSLRSDLLRHIHPLTVQDRFAMFLFYRDARTDPALFGGAMPYLNITGRMEDINYDCNRVRVEYQTEHAARQVHLKFFTDGSMPNFRCFAVSADNGSTWVKTGDSYSLPSSKGNIEPVGGPGELERPARLHHTPAYLFSITLVRMTIFCIFLNIFCT